VIRILALDVDGVLTDGRVLLDESGRELKSLHYLDIDAVHAARRAGLVVALVTGEDTPLVDVVAQRLGVDHEHLQRGAKDKADAVSRLAEQLEATLEEICFVGDSPRDAPALEAVGLGLAPADAHETARRAADRVLTSPGGRGAVWEAWELIQAEAATIAG
jgi:YrbI family 3-deoxy-D-manno-octulosonate 8-phosphate phosphatase